MIRAWLLIALLPFIARADVRLDGGPFLPYRINQAVLADATGMEGTVEIVGRRWDDTRVPLFRTRLTAVSESVKACFYLDEDIRALEVTRGEGEAIFMLDLAAEQRGLVATDEDTALRDRMRALAPPVHTTPGGEAPSRFTLMGSDLGMAGFQAASTLFRWSPPPAPALVLLGFSLIAALIAAIQAPTRRGKLAKQFLLVVLVLGGSATVLLLGRPKAILFRVAFPRTEAAAQLSGVLERRTEELDGYQRVTYSTDRKEEDAPVQLIGVWAPPGTTLPMRDALPEGAAVRFSRPPCIELEGSEYQLMGQWFVTGWVDHVGH